MVHGMRSGGITDDVTDNVGVVTIMVHNVGWQVGARGVITMSMGSH